MTRRLITLNIIALTCFICSVVGQQPDSALISELNKKIPKLIKRYKGAGISIALIRNGKTFWSEGYGYADIGKDIRASAKTIYQAASLSKPVTAMAVIKMAEDGLINLDDPVNKYLKRWQLPMSGFDNNEVTIRRVLSHTAGLSLGGFPGFMPGQKLPPLPEALDGANSSGISVKVMKKPGSEFDYSGGGYILLSLLIEEVSGISFEQYMVKNIFIPLGMERSFFEFPEHNPDLAQPYNSEREILPAYIYSGKGAASLYCTSEDLAKLISTLANNRPDASTGVLTKENLAEMISPSAPTKGDIHHFYDSIALGYFTDNRGFVSHTGSNRGWRCFFGIYPDKGDGIVIMTNSDNGRNIYIEILDLWVKLKGYDRPKMVRFFTRVFTVSLLITIILAITAGFYFHSLIRQIQKSKRRLVCLSRSSVMALIIKSISHLMLPAVFLYFWFQLPVYILNQLSPLTINWLNTFIIIWLINLLIKFIFPLNQER